MPSSEDPLFLRTKIRVMRPPHGAIARPRLDGLRDQALRVPLITLTAPGGFGKSTLAANWVAHWQAQGQHCTWLSLSPDDDEPARFLYSLVQALQRLGQGVGDAALALLQGRTLAPPRTVASLLLNDLEGFVGEALVVLDDYHCLHDPGIHDVLAFLITHAPPQLHIVITSRAAPPLALARLHAHGQWLDVDSAALRFDQDETTRFLASACPQPPSAQQINQLHASTEGWAAALRLAALSHSLNAAPGTPAPGHHSVFATLFEDLLASLPLATVRFMAQTAVLERLNAPLCDAVCTSTDSAQHMAVLLQYHLLTEPMDGQGHWLRYHPLLREHLLTQAAPRLQVNTLHMHSHAAHWFAQQQQWSHAVRHALQAGQTEQAVQWLAHCCKALVTSGDLLTLLGWRKQLPAPLLSTQPQVQLAVAWGLALAMRCAEADPLLADIERTARQTLQGTALHATLGECLAIRAVNVALQDDSLQAHAIVQEWQACGQPGDAFTRNAVSNVMRYVHWKGARLVDVYEQPWAATPPGEEQQIAFSTVYRHTILGSIELQKARLGLAERHAHEALRCAQQHGGAQSVSMALAAPLMAQLHYLQGRPAQAQALLAPLLALIDATAMHEAVIQAYQVLVRSAYHQGQAAQAFELLERGEALGYNRGWDRLVGAMLFERTRLLIAEGRLDEASATGIRMKRLAAHTDAQTPCARADLLALRDMALARIALADQHLDSARQSLAELLHAAHTSAQDLRALQLGTSLALAHLAAGAQDAGLAQLRSTLQAVQKSGALRCVLDEGDEIPTLLARFLISKECDAKLADFVRLLMAHAPSHPSADTDGAALLTERETRVIELVALGRSNKEIARQLQISAETVKTHLKNTFEKLGVQQRAQAVLVARSMGLLPEKAPQPSCEKDLSPTY